MLFKKIIGKQTIVPILCAVYTVGCYELLGWFFANPFMLILFVLMTDFFVFLFIPHILLWYADKIKKLDAPEVNNSLGEIFSQYLFTVLLARVVYLAQIIIYEFGISSTILLLIFSIILIATRLLVLYYSEKSIKLVISNLMLFVIIIFYHQLGVLK